MSLKYLLDSLDGLDESTRALYQEQDGKFVLAVDGLPQNDDLSGLKAKNQELLDELKKHKGKSREEEAARRKAEEEAAKKAGDIEALERSWNEKHQSQLASKDKELEGLQGSLNSLLIDNVAQKMAGELAVPGSADLLLPHIKQRLSVDVREGQHTTIVQGADGKASALTLDELKTEFANNPAFAPVIVGSKAKGSGADQGAGGGAAKTFNQYTGAELVALKRSDPDAYARLKASR